MHCYTVSSLNTLLSKKRFDTSNVVTIFSQARPRVVGGKAIYDVFDIHVLSYDGAVLMSYIPEKPTSKIPSNVMESLKSLLTGKTVFVYSNVFCDFLTSTEIPTKDIVIVGRIFESGKILSDSHIYVLDYFKALGIPVNKKSILDVSRRGEIFNNVVHKLCATTSITDQIKTINRIVVMEMFHLKSFTLESDFVPFPSAVLNNFKYYACTFSIVSTKYGVIPVPTVALPVLNLPYKVYATIYGGISMVSQFYHKVCSKLKDSVMSEGDSILFVLCVEKICNLSSNTPNKTLEKVISALCIDYPELKYESLERSAVIADVTQYCSPLTNLLINALLN